MGEDNEDLPPEEVKKRFDEGKFEVIEREELESSSPEYSSEVQLLTVEIEGHSETAYLLYNISDGRKISACSGIEKIKFIGNTINNISQELIKVQMGNVSHNESIREAEKYWKILERYYLKLYNEDSDDDYNQLVYLKVCGHDDHFILIEYCPERKEMSVDCSFDPDECEDSVDRSDIRSLCSEVASNYENVEGIRISIAGRIQQ